MVNSRSMATNDSFGQTDRKDNWWLEPLLIATGFGLFIIYTTWAAFQGTNYEWGPYLSPFYSPILDFEWFPTWFSPAFLILPIPLIFRGSCYYYRKAYYRSYFMEPPACAVGEPLPTRDYKGETAFPFILQNLHRYTLYLAIILMLILIWDAIQAFNFEGYLGVGLGSIIMLVNVIFLSLYTFSCHSVRHIIGGRSNRFSCCKAQHKAWEKVSNINEHHMRWAWISLFTVGFTDFYIRMLASGVFTEQPFITSLRLF